jgi:hypothetical protein
MATVGNRSNFDNHRYAPGGINAQGMNHNPQAVAS